MNPTPSPPEKGVRPQVPNLLVGFWKTLTEPSAAIREPERRRRARLLSALLFVLAPVSLSISILLPWLSSPDRVLLSNPVFRSGIATSAGGVIAFALSRTRHYSWAAGLTTSLVFYGTWAAVFLAADTDHAQPTLYFLFANVLIVRILVPLVPAIAVGLVNLAALSLLPLWMPSYSYQTISHPFAFLLFNTAFILMVAAMQGQDLRQIESQARAMAAGEEKWRTLASNAPDFIAQVDTEGRIQFLNRSLPGHEASAVIGTPISAYVFSEDQPRLEHYLQEVLRTGEPMKCELAGFGAQGVTSWHLCHLGPIRQDGHVTGVILVATDITARLRAEEERIRRIERETELARLRALDEFKTRFINLAAHELNTPLTPIRIHLHLLKSVKDALPDPRSRESVEILDRNVVRMGRLLQDFMDGARMQADHLVLRREPLDLRILVQETLDAHRAVAQERGVELEAQLGPLERVNADPARISQVLYNLLANALKFTPTGGQVVVETTTEGPEVIVRVRDSGLGFTPEQQASLFQPFSQAHEQANVAPGGTGLGLYISKGILEQHGGRIWCESPGPGRGSTFGFSLPLHGPASEATAANPVAAAR